MAFGAIMTPLLLYKRKLQQIREHLRELTVDDIKEFFEGNKNLFEANEIESIYSKPFNTDLEICREQLIFSSDSDDVLGSGEFGLVFRGYFKRDKHAPEILVAIKTVKPNVDLMYFKALLAEVKVLGFLGSHANIVSLVGAYTANIKNREIYVALEFCAKGDLLHLIKKHRADFYDLFKKEQDSLRGAVTRELDTKTSFAFPPCKEDLTKESVSSLSTLDLLQWSIETAQGMEFISSKRVVHGDLAARNILITAENVAKISDFGLSRKLHKYSQYTNMKNAQTVSVFPWRWMAIESLRDLHFSIETDVWAFGVTLYEIFSLGKIPFEDYNCHEFLDKLVAGHRLSPPLFGNEEIYEIMMNCMKTEPLERSTFKEMGDILKKIKDKVTLLHTILAKCN